MKRQSALAVEAAVALCAALALASATLLVGIIQYPGYDFGPAADAAWRLFSGQIPFKDFDLAFPLALAGPLALLSKLLGHKYFNAAAFASAACFSTFLWTGFSARLLGLGRAVSWCAAAAIAAALFFYYGFIWHTPLAYGAGAGAFSSFLLLAFGHPGADPESRIPLSGGLRGAVLSVFAASLCACLLGKPNAAWPVFFGLGAASLLSFLSTARALGPAPRSTLASPSLRSIEGEALRGWRPDALLFPAWLSSIAGAFVCAASWGYNLFDQIRFFLSFAGTRMIFYSVLGPAGLKPEPVFDEYPWGEIWAVYGSEATLSFAAILLASAGALVLRKSERTSFRWDASEAVKRLPFGQSGPLAVAAWTGAAASWIAALFFGFALSNDNSASVPALFAWGLLLLGAAWGRPPVGSGRRLGSPSGRGSASGDGKPEPAKGSRISAALAAAWCLLFLYQGGRLVDGALARDRVLAAGELSFWAPADLARGGGYFEGSFVWLGLAQLRDEAEFYQAQGLDLYYGPRIEHLWGELGRASPKGLPLWWDSRGAYRLADADAIAETFAARGFDGVLMQYMPGTAGRYPWDFQWLFPTPLKAYLAKNYRVACHGRQSALVLRKGLDARCPDGLHDAGPVPGAEEPGSGSGRGAGAGAPVVRRTDGPK